VARTYYRYAECGTNVNFQQAALNTTSDDFDPHVSLFVPSTVINEADFPRAAAANLENDVFLYASFPRCRVARAADWQLTMHLNPPVTQDARVGASGQLFGSSAISSVRYRVTYERACMEYRGYGEQMVIESVSPAAPAHEQLTVRSVGSFSSNDISTIGYLLFTSTGAACSSAPVTIAILDINDGSSALSTTASFFPSTTSAAAWYTDNVAVMGRYAAASNFTSDYASKYPPPGTSAEYRDFDSTNCGRIWCILALVLSPFELAALIVFFAAVADSFIERVLPRFKDSPRRPPTPTQIRRQTSDLGRRAASGVANHPTVVRASQHPAVVRTGQLVRSASGRWRGTDVPTVSGTEVSGVSADSSLPVVAATAVVVETDVVQANVVQAEVVDAEPMSPAAGSHA